MRKNAGSRGLALALSLTMLLGLLPVNLPVAAANAEQDNSLTLFYNQPASQTQLAMLGDNPNQGLVNVDRDQRWQQTTLPIGSGDLGANIYGEVNKEHLTFNEKTLWTGGPSTGRPNYEGGNLATANGQKMSEIYKQIQAEFSKHTTAGNTAASNLCNQLVGVNGDWNGAHTLYGNGYGSYQPWGDVYLDFGNLGSTTDYRRSLDLKTALADVGFTAGGTKYHREFLASNPDKVVAMRLTVEGSGELNFTLSFEDAHNVSGTNGNGSMNPSVTAGVDGGIGSIVLNGALSDNQIKYDSQMLLENTGGTVTVSGTDKLAVANATEVTIFLTGATNYKQDYPVYRTGETDAQLRARVQARVKAAADKGYAQVKADHIADYQSLFDRVSLDLGQGSQTMPTDQLIREYRAGTLAAEQKYILQVNLFQFGRYLTIASSREDSQLPANLQGVWANQLAHLWGSDYHMNVNLQMNYWPTYSTNLAECADPLIRYVDGLRKPGRVTAEYYVGVESAPGEENGFMAHTQNTPFGWTSPGWDFSWGWSPAAVPWILQNCWEHYEYTGDLSYMRENIYPMLKEEAKLYDRILVWDAVENRYVASPTYSPEHGPRDAGNTYEQTLAWQLYDDAITAAGLVGEPDAALIEGWKNKRDHLDPIQIGASGQIKEWYSETTLNQGQKDHRHLSHMLGLFPGDLIATQEDWMNAARYSMENRTDKSTGWGMGQRINTWARLGDGNKAYKLIGDLFTYGIYPNMWDAHAPFQIDGNFGYTSGVSEMLMQSNMGYLNLLPALPDAWDTGSVTGLVGRGNFLIDMDWAEGALLRAEITARNGGACVLRYPGAGWATVVDSTGAVVEFEMEGEDTIRFQTVRGETYTLTDFTEPEALHAPTGLAATRPTAEAVALTWSAAAGEGVPIYFVYRQMGESPYALLGTTTETSYQDDDAPQAIGDYHYRVAVSDGVSRSEPCAPVAPAACAGVPVASVAVMSESGVTTLGRAGSTLKLTAAVLPEGADSRVNWSVSDASLASIDSNGLLTIKDKSGEIMVTAASTSAPKKEGTLGVTIAITGALISVIVEDGTKTTAEGGDKNPAITYNGSWAVWSGEPTKFHGQTKTESHDAGDSIEYTFTGTKIDIYSHKHFNNSAFSVFLDNQAKEDIVLGGAGLDQVGLVASYDGLENTSHTIRLTVKAGTPKTNGVLDYFEAFSPAVAVDKGPLQALVEANQGKLDYGYTPETWAAFETALANAVAALNEGETTVEELTAAGAELTAATDALVEVEIPAPTLPGNAELRAQAVQTDRLVLTWPQVEKTVRYDVYLLGDTRGRSAGETLLGTTEEPQYPVSGLIPNTGYTFRVDAVSASEKATPLPQVIARTKSAADMRHPANVTGFKVTALTGTTAALSWNAVAEAEKYRIYLNGAVAAAVTQPGYQLTELIAGTRYTAKVVAVDSEMNDSLIPASIIFTPGEAPTFPVTISAMAHGTVAAQPMAAAEGEPVTLTVTPDSGYRLRSGSLCYNGNPISGTTFLMPAAAAVITGEFEATGGGNVGGGGGGSSTVTTTTKNSDGSVTTTVTDKKTGTVTETTKRPDGSSTAVETKTGGTVTTIELRADRVKLRTVVAPGGAVTADITLPTGIKTATVAIPAPTATAGTVALLVLPDGTEKVVMTSLVKDGAVFVPIVGNAKLRLADNGHPFQDVPSASVYHDAVAFASARGLLVGVGRGNFAPNLTTSRGMMATILYRLSDGETLGNQAGGAITFDDIYSNAWYADAVKWAVENGVTAGTGRGFTPGGELTREQVAVFLYNYAGSPEPQKADYFADAAQVSPWAKDALNWANRTGIMPANESGHIRPGENASRAETAVVLKRFVEYLVGR